MSEGAGGDVLQQPDVLRLRAALQAWDLPWSDPGLVARLCGELKGFGALLGRWRTLEAQQRQEGLEARRRLISAQLHERRELVQQQQREIMQQQEQQRKQPPPQLQVSRLFETPQQPPFEVQRTALQMAQRLRRQKQLRQQQRRKLRLRQQRQLRQDATLLSPPSQQQDQHPPPPPPHHVSGQLLELRREAVGVQASIMQCWQQLTKSSPRHKTSPRQSKRPHRDVEDFIDSARLELMTRAGGVGTESQAPSEA